MAKARKKYKLLLSISSIAIIILIILFLPKRQQPPEQEVPRTGMRYIPAPTSTQTLGDVIIEVNSQVPGDSLQIKKVSPDEPVYIIVEKDGETIAQSEAISEDTENISLALGMQTKEGDTLTVKAINVAGEEVFSTEVLVTATALTPGIILPRDLQ